MGKHIALNRAFSYIKGEITVIIDSDDIALPNMVDLIIKSWLRKDALSNNEIAEIVFERGRNDIDPLNRIKTNNYLGNINQFRYKNKMYGDYAETFNSKILKKYRFPLFDHEKFLSEAYIWLEIGDKYKGIFEDKILYITHYQVNGLTDNANKLAWNNPIGTLAFMSKNISIRTNWKHKLISALYFGSYIFKSPYEGKNFLRQMSINNVLLVITLLPFSFVRYVNFMKKINK